MDHLHEHQQPDALLFGHVHAPVRRRRRDSSGPPDPAFQDMKVFAINGTTPAALGIESGPKGIDRWFPKPVDPEVLVREITRELDGEGKRNADSPGCCVRRRPR